MVRNDHCIHTTTESNDFMTFRFIDDKDSTSLWIILTTTAFEHNEVFINYPDNESGSGSLHTSIIVCELRNLQLHISV